MALMDFIKKQFIDIIEWTEAGDGVLAWRFPMEDREIQNGGSLTVRESQMAVFVNEGKVADVFGPGRYTLTTATLPVLTYLQNWDKLFESPFKSDVYFFSTRQQIDQRWGTTQPVTIRDKDFGAVRLRAFGNYAYRIADPRLFYTEISGTREHYTVADLDGQLRGLMLQHISRRGRRQRHRPSSTSPPTRSSSPTRCRKPPAPAFDKLGLKLEMVTMQNVSLPEELQKILDQKIGMGMVGTTWASSCSTRPRSRSRSSPRARRRRRWRHRRRCDGPGRRRGARPGAWRTSSARACSQPRPGAPPRRPRPPPAA